MTVGNLAAITQSNVKRLLAYSSISHAGYMLLGLIAGNETGIQGVLVYVLVYTFMNLGAFLVVVALRRKDLIGEDMDDMAGLVHKSPGYAFLMLIFLLSLAGIPPTAGFIGKYFIFLSLIQTGHYVLAVIATLYVAVAIYYYFRIVRSMFIEPARRTARRWRRSFGLKLALAVTGIMTLGDRHLSRAVPEAGPDLAAAVRLIWRPSFNIRSSSRSLITVVLICACPLAALFLSLIERKVLSDFQVRLRPDARGTARPLAALRGRREAAHQGRHHPGGRRPGHVLARPGDLHLHRADGLLRGPLQQPAFTWPT